MTRDKRSLTIRQIETARRKVLRNAHELLEEAEILFRHRRYARAYALAHFCSEELARLPMLVGAGLRLAFKKPVDWKSVRSRLTSHHRKLLMLEVSENASLPWQGMAVNVLLFNARKNASLYAERSKCPSEVIGKTEAKEMLHLARARVQRYRESERRTGGQIKASVSLPELRAHLDAIEAREKSRYQPSPSPKIDPSK